MRGSKPARCPDEEPPLASRFLLPSGRRMLEVLRSNDAVLLSYAQSVLRQAGIASLIVDQYISVMEGSIGAFPRRLLVGRADGAPARRVLIEAGLDGWLSGEGATRA